MHVFADFSRRRQLQCSSTTRGHETGLAECFITGALNAEYSTSAAARRRDTAAADEWRYAGVGDGHQHALRSPAITRVPA